MRDESLRTNTLLSYPCREAVLRAASLLTSIPDLFTSHALTMLSEIISQVFLFVLKSLSLGDLELRGQKGWSQKRVRRLQVAIGRIFLNCPGDVR
jgi:hypothetical protein